jgi:transcriptional regulator with XRE-family HTH domain
MALRARKFRKSKGWSLDVTADHLGWSYSKVSRIETGKQNANIRDLEALASLYKCHISELFVGPHNLSKIEQSLLAMIRKLSPKQAEALFVAIDALMRPAD